MKFHKMLEYISREQTAETEMQIVWLKSINSLLLGKTSEDINVYATQTLNILFFYDFRISHPLTII